MSERSTPGSRSARNISPESESKHLKQIAKKVKQEFKLREYTQNVKVSEAYKRLAELEVDDWKNIPKCVKLILKDLVLVTGKQKEEMGVS